MPANLTIRENMVVKLQSDMYDTEVFQYATFADALRGIERLYRECVNCDDGIERSIILIVNRE